MSDRSENLANLSHDLPPPYRPDDLLDPDRLAALGSSFRRAADEAASVAYRRLGGGPALHPAPMPDGGSFADPTTGPMPVVLDDGATLPRRAHPDDAGIDLCMSFDLPIKISAGEIAVLPTGVRLSVLPGHVGKIEGRSGLATRGVVPLGAVPMDGLKVVGGQVPLGGIIDCNFTGAIGVIMANLGRAAWIAEPGKRVAQLVEYKVAMRTPVEVDVLPATERGDGGFGHTDGKV